ncbi:hypothetical protein H9Y04_35565 [Streptomyces sp. TRM66268-LWL]|uniref:Uncharacterized protein n=1 Tax=Streptomyces polyasparticus TaxID=2767826 RepID=A0ABR7SSU9_9ACTN|nr:hypothetical protein [Streptomyces polyasparticus]MBC9717864.1 hypothetical protein [Streptomyces polyasparticus]
MSSPYAEELNRLHAEIDHLVTVHRAGARLARALTEHLADEPFRLADQLAGLLEGRLEPEDLMLAAKEEPAP